MSQTINEMLRGHFTKNRIVFWYDRDAQNREIYESFDDPEIIKIELKNNEFAVKYRVLRLEPDKKFLIYSTGEHPPAEQNWLLDLEIGNLNFSTDKESLIVHQLGVPTTLKKVIGDRLDFFRNYAERLQPLAQLAQAEWKEEDLLKAMLSIAAARNKTERELPFDLDRVIISMSSAQGAAERWRHAVEWKLDTLFFDLVRAEYEIVLEQPEPAGIMLQLFMRAHEYQSGTNRTPRMRRAFLFVESWRQRKSETELYGEIALDIEQKLQIARQYSSLSDDELARCDLFPSADHELLERLSNLLTSFHADYEHVIAIARQRATTYWCLNGMEEGTLRSWYGAVLDGCKLHLALAELRKGASFRATSKGGLWEAYTLNLHHIDKYFRQLLRDNREAGSPPALAAAIQRARDAYLNDFLVPLSQRWQSLLDVDANFDIAPRQDTFFNKKVERAVKEGKRVIVIISDALRWEVGMELAERLEEGGKFKATSEAWCAMVPTYTAHGMAALLPHDTLELDTVTAEVRIDGQLVVGTEGRAKYLARKAKERLGGVGAIALGTEEVRSMSSAELEIRFKNVSLAYLYSAKIDSAGHSSDVELPSAVEQELTHLIAVIKRILRLNRTLVFITADHGFLFSGPARDDEYMLDAPAVQGETYRDQRFILGERLQPTSGLMRVAAPEPAFAGNSSALIAKGLMKLRRKGASGNFIHGGATMQELAIPVIQISELKKDIAHPAALSILGSRDITTPSITLKIFQEEPVGGTVLRHRVRLYFVSEDGTTISSMAECLCDSTELEEVNRAFPVSFEFFPEALAFKNKKAYLRIYTVAEGGTLLPLDAVEFRLKQIAYEIDLF